MQIGIIGGTGYTGQELLRLLAQHPKAKLAMVCSRSQAEEPVSANLPFLRGIVDMPFSPVNIQALADMDVVISATPNGVAMRHVPELLAAGVRVIDMAADFRLRDTAIWHKVYGEKHLCPELLDEAAYGLTEWNRDAVAKARLIANPGCYATTMQLALLPLMQLGDSLKLTAIVVDGKSGVSGAGKTANVDLLFSQLEANLSPYKTAGHRHTPEVLQQLHQANPQAAITFVPHLIPMTRGMLTTCYIPIRQTGLDIETITQTLTNAYRDCPFIDIMPTGSLPQTKSVAGTNLCRISAALQGDMLILTSVTDNLGKGAAGQAIQNLNVMQGWDETLGLTQIATYP